MDRGIFISFEGVEGAGKSTQLSRLKSHLETQGKTVVLMREPGGTPIGDHIRHLLLDRASGSRQPLTELLLFCASRSELVQTRIRPALERGEIVLCDRFTDSTVAYQGYAQGLPLDTIRALNRIATGGLEPDITFLLDMPVDVGLQRARARAQALSAQTSGAADPDRFEAEQLEFHQRVRAGFLALAESAPTRICTLSALQTVDAVFQDVIQCLTARFQNEAG